MVLWVMLEGLGLGALLVLVCAFGIRNGAVGMVHLYSAEMQERCIALGLTSREKINRSRGVFKLCCIPGYIAYVLLFVYAVNGARLLAGLLAVVRDPVCHESDRPFFGRRLLGRAYKCVDDPRYGGFAAVYFRCRQAGEVALRDCGHGGYRRGAGRDYGNASCRVSCA